MSVKKLKNYINGKWVEPISDRYIDVENPTSADVIAKSPLSGSDDVKKAVDAANNAFTEWSAMPVSRRCKHLFALADIVKNREEDVSRTLTEEMGKSLPDAAAELKRVIENIEVSCGMPTLQQGGKLNGCATGIDTEYLRLPRGVYTMIAPFNFPAMVPFWFLPYALATGNTYVVKPSEQVPCTMTLLTELIEEAGFPKGVYNMVNGDKAVSEALMDHPDVVGLSFVGSSRVCKIISATCGENNIRFQAMGSAKNHLIAMPDANLDNMVRNMITSCFGCAGQRCMAASAIVAVGDETYNQVCKRFVETAKNIVVADPLDPNVADEDMVMGPVISRAAKERIESLIETGVNEGATLALDGRGYNVDGCENGYFVGPTVFTDVTPGMEIHNTEIFGPVVVILKAATLDEAIGIINNHEYGNGASIYTQDGYSARKFKLETLAGMIGVNIGIPAPVAYFPFGGMKESSYNHIKAQGKTIVEFFTEKKVIVERFWENE